MLMSVTASVVTLFLCVSLVSPPSVCLCVNIRLFCTSLLQGFRVERPVSWKQCATGFEVCFLLFCGVCQRCYPISSRLVPFS